MGQYIEKFRNEEIDLNVFINMKTDDLIELSIDEADFPTFIRAFDVYREILSSDDSFNFELFYVILG